MLGDRPEVRDSHIGVVAHVSHEVVEFGCPRGPPGQERVVSAQHAPARRSFEDQAASAIGYGPATGPAGCRAAPLTVAGMRKTGWQLRGVCEYFGAARDLDPFPHRMRWRYRYE